MSPRLLVEGCAGLACLSLAVVCGRPTDAPWARPGSKTGYSRALLRLAGLTSWQPEEIVWAEPAPDARMMLQAYPRPELLREAAALCRAWGAEAGEQGQRELWARLKAEGPPGEFSAREVARVAAVQARTVSQAGVRAFGGRSPGNCAPQKKPDGRQRYPNEAPAAKLEAIAAGRWPPTRLYRDVREIKPDADALIYLDFPYFGTMSYGPGDITRPEALEVMRRWHAAGALVMASEAVPLDQELGEGWWAVDIGSTYAHPGGGVRGGANRGCVTEWVTMNREPAWRPAAPLPAVQEGLFASSQ